VKYGREEKNDKTDTEGRTSNYRNKKKHPSQENKETKHIQPHRCKKRSE
jgi:hypothetical protein